MYTVVRFTIDSERLLQLDRVYERFSGRQPHPLGTRRRRGDGYVADVSVGQWPDQVREIIRFIDEHRVAILATVAAGADVTFDVAIDDEDVGAMWLSIRCSSELASALSSVNAALELTFYRSHE